MQLYQYKKIDKYLELDEQDKQLFDFMYPILIRQGYITDTNQQMLNSFRGSFTYKSERSLRDHISKLIEHGLIERELVNKIENGCHVNIRYLYLNKFTFPELTTYQRPSNRFKAKNLEDLTK